jgi:cell wall-associated NlpC family hydrolase
MNLAIQKKIDRITQSFDKRIHHCQLEIAMKGDSQCSLSGRVLNKTMLSDITANLSRSFESVAFDTIDVELLQPGRPVTVCTSVTGLFAGPSFGTEMASGLLNGWSLEALIEKDSWAYVRQPDGYLGWVYRNYTSEEQPPAPTHLAHQPMSMLRGEPTHSASLDGRVAGGTAVQVERYEREWALIRLAGGVAGWLPAGDLRSLEQLPEDEAGRRSQMVADSATFTGIPYQWGGITAYGLDCSGYVQLLHRLVGVTIPRDADMQYEAGLRVEPPFKPGDLLFFASKNGHRSITHVGMSLGGWHIIHSSRSRNGVYQDDVAAVDSLNSVFAGACTFLSAPLD